MTPYVLARYGGQEHGRSVRSISSPDAPKGSSPTCHFRQSCTSGFSLEKYHDGRASGLGHSHPNSMLRRRAEQSTKGFLVASQLAMAPRYFSPSPPGIKLEFLAKINYSSQEDS